MQEAGYGRHDSGADESANTASAGAAATTTASRDFYELTHGHRTTHHKITRSIDERDLLVCEGMFLRG